MKKLTYPVVTALLAMMVLAPTAVAQEETTIIEETTVYPEGAPSAGDTGGATGTGDTTSDETMSGGGPMGSTTSGGADNGMTTTDGDPLPTSGGPGILAPAVALLLGAGVVTIAVLRRGR